MMFYDRGIYWNLIVRYDSRDPEAVRQKIGDIWKRLAPDVPYEGEFADQQHAELYTTDRARGQTFAVFALPAIGIARLVQFGLAASTPDRRTKDTGTPTLFAARSKDLAQLPATSRHRR